MSHSHTAVTKYCTGCHRDLPRKAFNRLHRANDGLQVRCRECFSAYNRERYAARRDEIKAAVYAYREANPGRVMASRVATCRKDPTHVHAYRAVEAALIAGILVRPSKCSACGSEAEWIDAHHEDYTLPLVVEWLCRACHRSLHELRRRAV